MNDNRPLRFTVSMTCESDAFADDPSREVARILCDIAESLDGYSQRLLQGYYHTVFDINGNDVGRWRLSRRE